MKIYTKHGDRGETSLFGGKRLSKDSLRIEAYGSVDELNSILGVVRSLKPHRELDSLLEQVQNELFVLGADLATPRTSSSKKVQRLQEQSVLQLEEHIDALDETLSPLRSFILPGGSPVAAKLHVARTVCRRAERLVVRLGKKEKIGGLPVKYLNRLSDLLFVLARYANKLDGAVETPWVHEK
jgi:cob(I)alamin adenosyltransferase